MKHITPARLDELDDLLRDLRRTPGLVETSRGIFYRKGRAFLHFHEDPRGLFADVRDDAGKDFDRVDVTLEPGRAALPGAGASLGPVAGISLRLRAFPRRGPQAPSPWPPGRS